MAESMLLEINGETRSVPSAANVKQLLRILGVGEDRIAVEVNRRIVRRNDWEGTPIAELDKVEIVRFVGGG